MARSSLAARSLGLVPVLASLALPRSVPAGSLPFERTEVREPCANFVATKQPFFGETHLHTSYSFDAVTIDTRNTPVSAYRYAKGERVGLPPWADTRTGSETPPPDAPTLVTEHPYCLPGEHCQFMATRTVQFPEGRALDFAAITDHSEQLGEANICTFEATQTCTDDSNCHLSLPRFRGHPNSHESAIGGCHGKAEAEEAAIVLAGVQGGDGPVGAGEREEPRDDRPGARSHRDSAARLGAAG